MSWRVVYVTNANKLSLNLNSLQILQEEQNYYVNLNEIAVIVIEDYTSVITTRLLIELANQGISVLILGLNKMPIGELLPISDNVRTSKKIYEQCNWNNNIKDKLWYEIIKGKIQKQIVTLINVGKKEKIELLLNNIEKMNYGDKTNMEGISARIYFRELFGENFIRFDEDVINGCLDLCYHFIRTIISKEIVARGFNTTLGINHKSQYNTFNFSDDIIEVFRPIVDYYVYNLLKKDEYIEIEEISKKLKRELIDVVNYKVMFSGRIYSILNAITYYINNVIRYVESDGKSDFEYPVLVNNKDDIV